jgi:hypothetical protein
MLAKRLARHGMALSGGSLAAVLAQNVASASAPPSVVFTTIKAASLFGAGQAVAAPVISVKVAALTEGVLNTMLLTKLKIATALLLAVTALSAGAGLLAYARPAVQEARALKPAPAGGGAAWTDVTELDVEGRVQWVAWNGKLIATVSGTDQRNPQVVTLWDSQTGKPKRTLLEITRPVFSAVFSPDGRIVACNTHRFEGTLELHEVKLIDPETGREKGTCVAPDNLHGPTIAFSPDGMLLAGGTSVKTEGGNTVCGGVVLWDVPGGKLRWNKRGHALHVRGWRSPPTARS